MHAEEGVAGVGNRVDQPPHQVSALGAQGEIFAAEGDDGRVRRVADEPGYPVGIQPAAGDDQVVGASLARGFQGDRPGVLDDGVHLLVEPDSATGLAHVAGQLL